MFPAVQSSVSDLKGALAVSKVQPSTNSNAGKAFLKFDFKDGSFAVGREAEDVTGDTIIVNTASIRHGWTLWANGTPTKVSAAFTQDLPEAPAPVGGDYPTESRSFEAAFPEEDDDSIIMFDSNSYGGRKGVDTILEAVQAKSAADEDTGYLFPIVKLDSESYKSKQGSIIHNPVFTITGWMDAQGNTEDGAAAPKLEVVEEEEAPKRRRRKAS